MFDTLLDVFSKYTMYYSIFINPFMIISTLKIITDTLHISIANIDVKLKKYWNEYIIKIKIIKFLDALIHTSKVMIIKIKQDNNVDFEVKLDNIIRVLEDLMLIYNHSIDNDFFAFSYYLKMQLFLSSIEKNANGIK